MPSFSQLPLIVKINEQFDRSCQRFETAGETTRRTLQSRQIMPQISIAAFDRKGLTFVFEHPVIAPVAQVLIHQKTVRVVILCWGRGVDNRLQYR